jgi:plasmid maintenance system antidote protein VapI
MKNTNKLLEAVKEYFSLESEKELAVFLNISESDVESICDGRKPLSIENKVTILNFIDCDKKKGLSLFEKLERMNSINGRAETRACCISQAQNTRPTFPFFGHSYM